MVEYWQCMDLGPPIKKESSAALVHRLIDALDAMPEQVVERTTRVYIEAQKLHRHVPTAPVLIGLVSWWYMKKGIRVEIVHPQSKFKFQLAEHKLAVKECAPRNDITKYRACKQHAVAITLKLLQMESEVDAITFFSQNRKKDDLADAFLLAIGGL